MRKIQEAEESEMSESESDVSYQDIESLFKDIQLIEGVGMVSKHIIVEVTVKNKPVQFRLDTWTDVTVITEKSREEVGNPQSSEVSGRLRNASGDLMQFKGVFTALSGSIM
jgi:hypothetical protein